MLFALSDFAALNLLVSSSAAGLCVQATFLPPFSFLVRVADLGKKGCQPAGQIFIVITSRKGIFPAWSPAERIRSIHGYTNGFSFSNCEIALYFFFNRTGSYELAASDWFSNWQFWIRPFGIITLCIVLLLVDPFQNDSPLFRANTKKPIDFETFWEIFVYWKKN